MLALSACSSAAQSIGDSTPDTSVAPTEPPVTTVAPPATTPVTEPTVPALDVYDPLCVVEVQAGESLSLIADRFDDDTVRVDTIASENDLVDNTIHPGQLLDVCVDNGLDDRTGVERPPNQVLVDERNAENVKLQQTKLNELFAPFMAPLTIDGQDGSVTRQRLCAARLALGLTPSTLPMEAGSTEEQVMMAAPALLVPTSTAMNAERWVLVDQTCQIMFVGAGPGQIQFVFPTSTGAPGFETRLQDQARAWRFDPATDNGGWHDSTDFPVPEDNPLNGNMYKPVYFDNGLAIHGANNVPTSPQSKGCARLRVADQDALVAWLGLAELTDATNDRRRINLTVNIQGLYVPG
jgi:LysM repeat protein